MPNKKSKKNSTPATGDDASLKPMENNSINLPPTVGTGEFVYLQHLPRLNRKTIVTEFERCFGNETQLENWQRLCRDVGIVEDLPSINKCKEALKGVWVNIYDLVDAVRAGNTPPKRFQNQRSLAAYTIKYHKVFPKKKAKKRGLVRALLAHIF